MLGNVFVTMRRIIAIINLLSKLAACLAANYAKFEEEWSYGDSAAPSSSSL